MIATLEFPEGFRRGAKIRGWDLGQSRQPLSPQQSTAADATQRKLQEMLAGFDFVQSRPSTVHKVAAGASDEVINRIVHEVLSQLKSL
jgi:4-hydroxy-tetrahydrodipicolinate synthase